MATIGNIEVRIVPMVDASPLQRTLGYGGYVAPQSHKELTMAEAVELCVKEWGGCWQTLFERLAKKNIVLARRA